MLLSDGSRDDADGCCYHFYKKKKKKKIKVTKKSIL